MSFSLVIRLEELSLPELTAHFSAIGALLGSNNEIAVNDAIIKKNVPYGFTIVFPSFSYSIYPHNHAFKTYYYIHKMRKIRMESLLVNESKEYKEWIDQVEPHFQAYKKNMLKKKIATL